MMKPARKRKRTLAKTAPSSALPKQESPEWLKQMYSYYQENKSYRAEDVERVLGDARETVQAEGLSHSLLACRVVK